MGGKGRGRGKAREPQPQSQQQTGQSQQQRGGPAPAAQPQARASAWGAPAGAPAAAPARPPQRAPDHGTGDISARMEQVQIGGAGRPPAGGNGNGGQGGPAGRGSVRGRRPIDNVIVRTRPANLACKQGKDGRPLDLLANYFMIKTAPDWVLHQYRVDIAPEEDRTYERKKLLGVHRDKLGGYLFDGTVLYTSNPLTTPQNKVLTWTSANDPKEAEKKIFTLTIKEVGDVARGDFAYIQIFNLLLRTCISGLDLQLVGRDYYDAKAHVLVPEFKLELWPGYKTSIRQHETNILMCVEITHKVMRMETVLDILADLYHKGSRDYRRDFIKEVVGCIVLTKYNNKTYRIDDVDFNTSPSSTFLYKDKQISYAQYMLMKYEIKIKDMNQPMLVSKAKARDVRAGMAETIMLIPEVCFCTGLTDEMRANFRLMSALAKHTRVGPDTRIAKLRNFNQRLQGNEKAVQQLRKFDMTLEKDIVAFRGRQVQEEVILFGGGNKLPSGPNVDWTGGFRKCPLLLLQDLKDWVIVVPSKFKRDAIAFVDTLKRAASGMRFRFQDPDIFDIQRDGAGDYANALSQILDQHQPQLIMCAVPNNRGDRYAAIKKKCCVDRAVPTQVIQCRNLNDPKKTMSIATKVAVQMNCKIGGAAWSVDLPLPSLMVVGFDVCHDTSSKQQSFGAMVASLDKPLSRYFSAVTPHNNGEELSNNLAANILKALRKFRDVNGDLPKRIVVYRDGVGEGQIPFVHSFELEVLRSKLAQVYGDAGVMLTYIIVTKRINSRIFTRNMGNPPPGTVIDDVITDPEKYDFFLVSQSVREGTVSPTSYNVIFDGMNMPPERLQRLTYKMCHMYFNWSGTVRVPAPCQYAHKLAFLVGQSLHREPNAALEDLLYFL